MKTLFRLWRREFRLVFGDQGVVIFFLLLPTLYPIVYTLIYNPEVVKEVETVVVDHSGTAASRELIRMIDRTESIDIRGFATDLADAREALARHEAYAIIEVPADYGKRLGRGEQATVPVYCDMSLLLRYRQILFALTDVQLAVGSKLQARNLADLGEVGEMAMSRAPMIGVEEQMIGDPTQGFASFVMPGILVIILQQSIVLGMCMLAGGAAERRRRNGGGDPLFIDASPGLMIVARTLCVLCIYVPLVIYTLYLVPMMFSLPHGGDLWQAMLLILPMVIASTLMGQVLGVFCSERESVFVVVVFTSVVFLFLSGLTWPRFAMGWWWQAVGAMIPATWGVEGFVRINSNCGHLWQQERCLLWLWGLCAFYFILAWLVNAYHRATFRNVEMTR